MYQNFLKGGFHMFKTIKDFRTALMSCTYDDEVWALVKVMKYTGDTEVKELALHLEGMDVDEAQAYLRANP